MNDVTIDDILAEIRDTYRANMRQAGDMDARQVAEAVGVTDRQAHNVMKKIAERPEWTLVKVYDPDGSVHRWVLRKVEIAGLEEECVMIGCE